MNIFDEYSMATRVAELSALMKRQLVLRHRFAAGQMVSIPTCQQVRRTNNALMQCFFVSQNPLFIHYSCDGLHRVCIRVGLNNLSKIFPSDFILTFEPLAL